MLFTALNRIKRNRTNFPFPLRTITQVFWKNKLLFSYTILILSTHNPETPWSDVGRFEY